MKAILYYFLLCISLASYASEDSADMFLNKMTALWPASFKVEKLSAKVVNSGFAIMRPPLTWIPLIRLTGAEFEGKGFTHCLYYLVPRHSRVENLDQPGLLKVVEVGLDENCNDKYVRSSFAFLKGVDQLYFYLSYPGLKDYQSNNLKPNQIVMRFFYRAKEVVWEIPLYNISSGKIKSAASKRLSEQWDLRAISTRSELFRPGMHVGPLTYKRRGVEPKIEWQNPSMDDENAICLTVDDQCQVKGSVSCEYCRSSPISANALGCSSSFHKICGNGVCGERNMPACPRGNYYLSSEHDPSQPHKDLIGEPCSAGEKNAICRGGLKPFCNEHGVQICI